MSVLSTQCNPAFSHSLGFEPEGVFSTTTLAYWGCGVTDSIRGFEPLDSGSIPDTLTGLSLLQERVNVADITGVCEPPDLGSNPGTLTNSRDQKEKTEEKNMSEIMKKINEKISDRKTTSFNDVSGFIPARQGDAWHYIGRMPHSRCTVFVRDDWVEIHNVIVIDSAKRCQGHGTTMIANIRQAFPEHHIWVNTAECSRGFWQKMIERGHIDSIENEYPWPCWDTNCIICHPTRATGKRRDFSW